MWTARDGCDIIVMMRFLTLHKITRLIAAALMLAALTTACSGRDTDTPQKAAVPPKPDTSVQPADIPEGSQCYGCGMTVDSKGLFASEAVTMDGKYRYFCDIGDLLIYLSKLDVNESEAAFVHDYSTGKWVSAYDAFYLADAPVKTPMRFGIAAFERRPDAESFRAKNGGGTIYTYAGIQAEKPYE